MEGRVKEDVARWCEVVRTSGFKNQCWRVTGMAMHGLLLTLFKAGYGAL